MITIDSLKSKALHNKATVNLYAINEEMQRYYYDQGLDNWRNHFVPAWSAVIEDSGKTWAGALGMRFDLRHLLAEEWFSKYALKFAQETTQTNLDGIHDLVAVGLSEGWGADKLGRQMKLMFEQWAKGTANPDKWLLDRMPLYRTTMIARTESMHSLNAGNAALYQDWGVGQHEWLATIDAVTRPAHAAANGQVVDVGKPFNVGGEQIMHPGEGSPENAINCRCTTIPVIPDQTAAEGEQPTDQPQDVTGLSLQNALAARSQDYVDARKAITEKLDPLKIRTVAGQQNYQDLKSKTDALTRAIGTKITESHALEFGSPEHDAARAVIKAMQAERDAANALAKQALAEWTKAAEVYSKQTAKTMVFGEDATIETTINETFKRKVAGRLRAASDFLAGLLDGETNTDIPTISVNKTTQKRAFAIGPLKQVYMNSASDTGTFVHEMGHVLEAQQPGWFDRAVEFLELRTKGQPMQRMMDIYPGSGYSSSEVTIPDKFFHPYIGKIYLQPGSSKGKVRATEVISMGIERMYRDPVGFAAEDPQHFDLIMGLVRGWL